MTFKLLGQHLKVLGAADIQVQKHVSMLLVDRSVNHKHHQPTAQKMR